MNSTRSTADSSPLRFAFAALGSSVALFALLRTSWAEERLLLPLTRIQRDIATWYAGRDPLPVDVGLSCSAADVIALCLGAVLAFPAPWRTRLSGAAWGMAVILALNTVRIGTLGGVFASAPAAFEILHVYVWPGVLLCAVTGYVFLWMRRAERPARTGQSLPSSSTFVSSPRGRRFCLSALALVGLFTAGAPWILESAAVLGAAAWVAHAAAGVLGAVGLPASVSGNMLWTSRGGFLVTQECVATPLIPVYLAAALSLPASWVRRVWAVLAILPLVVILAVARLLSLALPSALLNSPLPIVHGFNQLLVGVLIVAAVAVHREGVADAGAGAVRRALRAALTGLVLAGVGAAVYTKALLWVAGLASILATHTLTSLTWSQDGQGALWLLPAYQFGLLIAVWIASGARRGRRLLGGLVALALSQLAVLILWGEAAAHLDLFPHALAVRAWAVAGPLLVAWPATRTNSAPAFERTAFKPHAGALSG